MGRKKKRFLGVYARFMRRLARPGKILATPIARKDFNKIVTADGVIYEDRPDGRRRIGFKA